MKAKALTDEEKKAAVKDFNFPMGIAIALLSGFMSGCFNVGLEFGKDINFGDLTDPMFRTLPATLLVTVGGFVTNLAYCFYQNQKNHTWTDYGKRQVWANNLVFCLLAGALWYSQFFGLSLGSASSWHSMWCSPTCGASYCMSGAAVRATPSWCSSWASWCWSCRRSFHSLSANPMPFGPQNTTRPMV